MGRFILIGVFLGILNSCQPPVVFGEPQPAHTEPLSGIPQDYRGIYWCKQDSASLVVDDKAFIKHKEFLIKLTRSEIESNKDLELRQGRLFVKDLKSSFPAEEKGDTIISSITVRDTIFTIRPDQVLKPFKGHLILNTKIEENAWVVLVASQKESGLLSLSKADIPENLEQLESISPVKIVSENNKRGTQIYINPTAEQFGRILDKGLLFDASCSEFERIIPLRMDSY